MMIQEKEREGEEEEEAAFKTLDTANGSQPQDGGPDPLPADGGRGREAAEHAGSEPPCRRSSRSLQVAVKAKIQFSLQFSPSVTLATSSVLGGHRAQSSPAALI